MLKFTSLAIGLLTVITLVPAAQATTANTSPISVQTPAKDLHSQIIVKIGGQPEYRHRGEAERRQELEREREAALRRYQSRGHREYRRDNRSEYHRVGEASRNENLPWCKTSICRQIMDARGN